MKCQISVSLFISFHPTDSLLLYMRFCSFQEAAEEAAMMEEERAVDEGERREEMDALQREAELPLEEIMRRYGCGAGGGEEGQGQDVDEEEDEDEEGRGETREDKVVGGRLQRDTGSSEGPRGLKVKAEVRIEGQEEDEEGGRHEETGTNEKREGLEHEEERIDRRAATSEERRVMEDEWEEDAEDYDPIKQVRCFSTPS